MRQVLHAYKLRLTNLSQGNRSLKLARLSVRRDIDLRDLAFLDGKSAEALLSAVIAGKEVPLIRQLDPRHEATNLVDRKLNNIFRSVEMLLAESGTYDLHLGYPFVEGKFVDGTPVRCPLVLFPVRLERDFYGRPRWRLSMLPDPVTINPTFFLAYEQYQGGRFPPEFWEEEISPSTDWRAWVQALYEKIKEMELSVNFNSALFDLKLESFPDLTKDAIDRLKVGVLTLRPQAVLGVFPQSDSTLLQDYEEIEKNIADFPLETYFGEAPEALVPEKPIKEEDRYFALPVDASQEEVLLLAKRGISMVMHGPPGTGKSQVIVNLVTDALAHGKRVLVVSSKRAALDVVFKRLDGLELSRFAMLVHDHRHDRQEIYAKLLRQIEDIESFQAEFRDLTRTVADHDYRVTSRLIDVQTHALESLVHALQDRSKVGISPHELYLVSSPSRPFINLREPALRLSQDRLILLLEKLRAIREYREFFQEDYPWKHRLSFRHHNQADRQRLAQQLSSLPQQVKELKVEYEELTDSLGQRLLDPELNRQRTEQFQNIDRLSRQASVRADLEALQLDGYDASAVKKQLVRCARLVERLRKRKVLTDEDWGKYEDLARHLKSWDTYRTQSTKWMRLSFLQARWYLHRLILNKALTPSFATIEQIKRDFRHVQALQREYVSFHQRAFLGDFPLLDTQEEKERWIEEKGKNLALWAEMRDLAYFPRIRPKIDGGTWDERSWQESMSMIQALDAFTNRLQAAHQDWRLWLHPQQMNKLDAMMEGKMDLEAEIAQWSETFRQDFFDLHSLDTTLAGLDPTERSVLDLVEKELASDMPAAAFQDLISNSVYLHWLEALEEAHPVLREVSGRGWIRSLEDYQKKYQDRQPVIASLVSRQLKERIVSSLEYNRLKNRVTYRDIQHQVKKKRNRWPIRKLIAETWNTGLQRLAPCWLASPESAAAMLPMQAGLFDLVIFDEASQCFVERSLPVMLRGKQVIIAGDDRQLPPSDLYRVRYEDDPDGEQEQIALEVVSVLDLARQTLREKRLTWHYRSESEALIRFSNHRFYEGSLQMIPSARLEPLHQPAIVWEQVAGKWQDQSNEIEARKVIELIMQLSVRADHPSIGVVTFNFRQQELILDLLDRQLETLGQTQDPGHQALRELQYRVSGEEHQGLFVKNIENVQGDERDVIIFSVGYARNDQGKLQTRFGLLNQAGGENRLNVAVTRARWQVFVVSSFLPEELEVDNTRHEGPKALKSYLRYARDLSQGLAPVEEIRSSDTFSKADFPIAAWLKERLAQEGYEVYSGLGDTGYQLDLAVKRPSSEAYLLGIECEGPRYFRGISAKERDLYRPQMLVQRNWTVIRVWARNVWHDPEKEWERVKRSLREEEDRLSTL